MKQFRAHSCKRGRCGSGPLTSANTQRDRQDKAALVLHTMIVDAAPVGPFGGLSYRFCGFAARQQACQSLVLVLALGAVTSRATFIITDREGRMMNVCDLNASTAAVMNTK